MDGFREQYRTLSDEELLKVHYDAKDLIEEARLALDAEMRSRGLNKPKVIDDFRKDEKQRHKDEQLSRTIYDWRKIVGTRYFKSDYQYVSETGIETFATTLFFTFSALPLIPTGTYRVEKKKGLRYDYRIIEKLPLDWGHVLKAWLFSASAILLMIVFVKLVRPHLNR